MAADAGNGPDPSAGVAVIIFIIGILIGFPLGLSREVLRGSGQLHRANFYDFIGIIAQGGLISLACWQQWSLATIMLIASCCSVLPLLAMSIDTWRDSRWRPHWRYFEWRRLGSLAGLECQCVSDYGVEYYYGAN